MDPNETLKRMRELAEKIIKSNNAEESAQMGDRLADHFQALDSWLFTGGFLPKDWERIRK